MKTLGVVKELNKKETRVALVPEVVETILKKKLVDTILIESHAGSLCGFSDEDYKKVGATIVFDLKELKAKSDIVLGVEAFNIKLDKEDQNKILIGFLEPFKRSAQIKKLKRLSITALALEKVPRTSRAQSLDALSSQANISGYLAVILAQSKLKKIFPMLMTSAGTINPAKVLILGAGVAGLSAIATAKRLGAVVYAYDVRKAVKEQTESLGAKFVNIEILESGEGKGGYAKALSEDEQIKQRKDLTSFAKNMDVIITTAQIPGQKAPLLLDDDIFSFMKNDSVIIDMAASTGGNVLGTIPNQWIKKDHVLLYGAVELSRLAPKDASFTFSKNILSLLELNFDDEIIKAMA